MPHVDEAQIHAYLDQQLEYAEQAGREELEQHVQYCADCATLLEETSKVHARAIELLGTIGPDDLTRPPFEVIQQRARARRGGRDPNRHLDTMKRLAWAASVVLALGLGLIARPLMFGTADRLAQMETAPGDAPAAPAFVASESKSLAPATDEAAAEATRVRALSSSTPPRAREQRRDEPVPPSAVVSEAPADFRTEPELALEEQGATVTGAAGAASAGVGGAASDTAASRAVLTLADRIAPTERKVDEVRGALAERVAGRLDTDRSALAPDQESAQTRANEAIAKSAVAQLADVDSSGLARQREAGLASVPAAPVSQDAAPTVPRRGTPAPAAWIAADGAEAARRLGGQVAMVEGLPIEGVFVLANPTRDAVRVVQRLDSGELLELLQRPVATAGGETDREADFRDLPPGPPGSSTVRIQWQTSVVEGRAMIARDSLRGLLARLGPSPDLD